MKTTPIRRLPAAVAAAVATLLLNAHAADTPLTRDQYNANMEQANARYKNARDACLELRGNDEDVCIENAKAMRAKARASLEAQYKGTAEAHLEAKGDAAEADYKVAKEKCDALNGDAKDICIAKAKAGLEKTEATLDAAEERLEADYKVARAKCDSLSAEAKRSCVAEAKRIFIAD